MVSMVITPDIRNSINDIVGEFALNHKAFNESPEDFFSKQNNDGVFLFAINCSDVINDKERIVVRQLYRSKVIEYKIRLLAGIVKKKANINCYPSELINPLLYYFCKLINNHIRDSYALDDLIERDFSLEICEIKKKILKKRGFGFPFHMMGLTTDVSLSDYISIELSGDVLNDAEVNAYMFDRHMSFNAFLKVKNIVKVSHELGLDHAKKVSLFVANFINMHCNMMGINNAPCISSDARIKNCFNFYQVMEGNETSKATVRNFYYSKSECEKYWEVFIDYLNNDKYISDRVVLSTLMQHCLVFSSKRRVADIIINSVNWYADAFSDENKESQIVKCVTGIESLVNYGFDGAMSSMDSDGFTVRFRKRVCKLHKVKADSDISRKANAIYKARSEIVHGSGLSEPLIFCPLKFCRETVFAAIPVLFEFGLERTSYKKSLSSYIDGLGLDVM
jgi:hypothetical protein